MRSVSTATAERMRVIGESLEVAEFSNATPSTWREAAKQFLRNGEHSPEFRAGLSLLAIHGNYPSGRDFDAVRHLIALDAVDATLARIATLAPRRRDRRGQIMPSVDAVFDITRYSAERFISGIPRVVRNLITSQPTRSIPSAVWVNAMFAPVTVHPRRGTVGYPREVWTTGMRHPGLTDRINRVLRALALTSPIAAYAVFQVLRWIPLPAALVTATRERPKATLLLANTTVVVGEVMGREVADRLVTWQRVGVGVSTRFIVHDMLPLTHSEYFSSMSSHEFLLNLEAYFASEQLFVSTPLLAQQIRDVAQSMGRCAPDVVEAPIPVDIMGVSLQSGAAHAYPYVVAMGGFDHRKRLEEFIDYVIAHRTPNDSFRVVIVGRPPLVTNRHTLGLISRIVSRPDVFETRWGMSDDELTGLVHRGLATVYVSDAEGYGLPILESLSVGTPVIASCTPVNEHLNGLHGGIHMVFDSSSAAIDEIRRLHDDDYRAARRAEVRSRTIPHDIATWAETITDGLRRT